MRKPDALVFDMVLNAAKIYSSAAITSRDNHPHLALGEVRIRITDVNSPPWVLFEVIFNYWTNEPALEPKDDLQVFVPWNRESGTIGEIKGRTF